MRKVVGVNAYTERGDEQTPILRIDPQFETDQIHRVQTRSRAPRSRTRRRRAGRDPNLPPETRREPDAYLLDAARADVTEGEMVQSLQKVFGTYAETPAF